MKKYRLIFPLSIVSASLFLSGCSGMMSTTEWFFTGNWVPRFTVEEAFADLEADYSWEPQMAPILEEVQPKNKQVACKVHALDNNSSEGITTYWDGRCKNGFAVGLGKVTYIQGNKVFERILSNNSRSKDVFVNFFARDYSERITYRGQIKNENTPKTEYWAITETLQENPLSNEASIFREFVYRDAIQIIRKAYHPESDSIFTVVERNGLRYIRIEINNPSINAPSLIECLGRVSDGSLSNSIGEGSIPRFSRYIVNGNELFVRMQNGNREIVRITGQTQRWGDATYLLDSANEIINSLDLRNLTTLENSYYQQARKGKFKKPKGLSEDIYNLDKQYYNQAFLEKVDKTLNKHRQELQAKKQRQNQETIEQARLNEIRAARAQASTNAMLNSILQSNEQALSQGMNNLYNNSTIPSVAPLTPTGPGSVDVYNVQRINDNLYGIQKVK